MIQHDDIFACFLKHFFMYRVHSALQAPVYTMKKSWNTMPSWSVLWMMMTGSWDAYRPGHQQRQYCFLAKIQSFWPEPIWDDCSFLCVVARPPPLSRMVVGKHGNVMVSTRLLLIHGLIGLTNGSQCGLLMSTCTRCHMNNWVAGDFRRRHAHVTSLLCQGR